MQDARALVEDIKGTLQIMQDARAMRALVEDIKGTLQNHFVAIR